MAFQVIQLVPHPAEEAQCAFMGAIYGTVAGSPLPPRSMEDKEFAGDLTLSEHIQESELELRYTSNVELI